MNRVVFLLEEHSMGHSWMDSVPDSSRTCSSGARSAMERSIWKRASRERSALGENQDRILPGQASGVSTELPTMIPSGRERW